MSRDPASETAAGLCALAAEQFCDLTTVGRRSGRPHTIEIWFGTDGAGLFLISGGADRSDWVRNLQADRSASVRVADSVFAVDARVPLTEPTERERAVRLLHDKYGGQVSGTLADWLRDAFIVALDPIADVDRSSR